MIGKLKRKLRTLTSDFARTESGSTALSFAAVAVPLVAAAGIAVDGNRILYAKTELQILADNAALYGAAAAGEYSDKTDASASFVGGSDIEMGGLSYSLKAAPNAGKDDISHFVEVSLYGNVKGTLSNVLNMSSGSTGDKLDGADGSSFGVSVTSKARYKIMKDKLVCVLALNTSAEKAIHLQGNGGFDADKCGMHSDSISKDQSLYMNGGALAEADFFHTVGGWSQSGTSGSFSVEPEGGKAVFGDPFKLTTTGCPASSTNDKTATGSSSSPTSIAAGTYRNISVNSNKHGTMAAGIYYVTGTVDVKGTLTANNVTIVLCGSAANINMGAQGVLKLQAPTSGAYKGFAVVGSTTATHKNYLIGGSGTYVRGAWYTPKAALEIGGNSEFNGNSKYFPVVVDTFLVSGTGNVNIGVDYDAYNYERPEDLYKTETTVWLAD